MHLPLVSERIDSKRRSLHVLNMSQEYSHSATIRDLALFLGLIIWSGVIFLTSYYNEFGLRYSDIGFEYYHVLFRGVSTIFLSFWGLAVASIALICILLPLMQYSLNFGLLINVATLQRAIILLSFVAMFIVADSSGFSEAQKDSVASTTSLREITSIRLPEGQFLPVFAKLTAPVAGADRRVFIVTRTGNRLMVIAPPIFAQAGTFHPRVTTIFLKPGEYYEDQKSHNRRNFWRSLF